MIGLLVITHGQLASALLEAAGMIVGPQAKTAAMDVRRDQSPEELRSELAARLHDLGADGDGVLIFTDMFGGTPSNLSVPFLAPGKVEVLSGVNLPMVLKFFSSRDGQPVDRLALTLKDYGRQGIAVASELLQQR